ncbi:MAG TPA: adenosylcobinamide-GDP ribazoletransferase [Magnetospirillaceae bacterium]|jgi:adenosylcobinamide-GDP ribazoletransferase
MSDDAELPPPPPEPERAEAEKAESEKPVPADAPIELVSPEPEPASPELEQEPAEPPHAETPSGAASPEEAKPAEDPIPEDDLDPDDADDIDAPLTVGGLYLALSFLTRLPLRLQETPAPGALARAMGMFPLAGIVVGGIGAAVYGLIHQLLPATASAVIALASTILVTGGLHEDGLADTLDGFGGGATRARKLEIMRDSRIGTYGVLALMVSFALRAITLAEIGDSLTVAGALIAAHALGRGAIPIGMQALIPARTDGLGASAGQPSAVQIGIAIVLAVIAAGLVLPTSVALAALAGATLGMVLIVGLAQWQIGGYTGDVLGAIEQSAETLALLGVLAAL